MGKPNIIIAGILDTKGQDIKYIAKQVEKAGGTPIIMELSLGSECGWADISLTQLLDSMSLSKENIFELDRANACRLVTECAVKTIQTLRSQGKVDGIISTGGSMGTTIATAMMRALPIGVPKLMLSSDASGEVSVYVGTKDICMMYPIAESGLNNITRRVLTNAAYGIVGMASASYDNETENKPLIGCMMFGVTTPCILQASKNMEQQGYEVIINHCTGSGGQSMEEMLAEGHITGMLDLTTEEVTADVFDTKFQRAGPERLRTAAHLGIPQVVSVGGSELMLFEGTDDVPEKLMHEIKTGYRKLYNHNPTVACVAITAEETEKLAEEFINRLACATAPTVICIPMRGWGGCDIAFPSIELGWAGPGPGPTWIEGDNPEHSRRSEVFLKVLREKMPSKENIEVLAVDKHINEKEFANLTSNLLTEMLNGSWERGHGTELPYVESIL